MFFHVYKKKKPSGKLQDETRVRATSFISSPSSGGLIHLHKATSFFSSKRLFFSLKGGKENRLVEAEALGRVGQDVGVNRVRGVRGPVGDRTFLGGQGLHDAAQPREHGQSAVLQFLDLQLFQVTRFGQGQRVESATRGDIPDGEFVKDRVNHASSVRFGTANQDGFDDQNVPEGRVAGAFRRQRGDGARELVRDGGAVIRGAQGTRGEPRDAGAVFGGPGASDAQHGPSAVDDFTLGVLFVAERDDRGFAPTRVGTEFRVDVSLDNLGDGLGLFLKVEKSTRQYI